MKPNVAKKQVIAAEGRDRPRRDKPDDLLFAVIQLEGGRFKYEGINSAFASLLQLPSGNVSELDVFECMGSDDSDCIREILQECLSKRADVRIRHRLGFGGRRYDVETIAFPVLVSETGVAARLMGRHRMIVPGKCDDGYPDALVRVNPDLASIQEDIQQRIASELHDSTCQHLIAASLRLLQVRNCTGGLDGARSICEDVDASIDRALREIRALTYLLHPQDVMGEGLKATIECYARGFAARTALRVRIGVDARADRLPYEGQRSVLRIVQEGLTNIFRHARATEVEIVAQPRRGQFRLTISDNGRGYPVRSGRGGSTVSMGVGIPAMRQRLARLGGSLAIRSDPGTSGTMLCAVFPFLDRGEEQGQQSPLLSRKPTQVSERKIFPRPGCAT
jgi:signal transduction histidine kinase